MSSAQPQSPAKIRPAFWALHGQLENIKQLAELSERRASDLEERLREQEDINRELIGYMNSTTSIHMLQTPSRSFLGAPITPSSDLGHRMRPAFQPEYTPTKHRDFAGASPNRPPPSAGTPSRSLPGSVSPGLSPITKVRGGSSRSGGGRHDGWASSPLHGMSMPTLHAPDARSLSSSRGAEAGPGHSDDGSDSLPPYGYTSDGAQGADRSPSAPLATPEPNRGAYTPPRSSKPITPAPRSHGALASEWVEDGMYPRLHYSSDGAVFANSSVEGSSATAVAREEQPSVIATGSRDSEDYSQAFEDDISEPVGRDGAEPAEITHGSLHLMSMLDLSGTTMKSAMSAASLGAFPTSAAQPHAAEPIAEGSSSDSLDEPIPPRAMHDASLSFSLSASNMNVKMPLEFTSTSIDPVTYESNVPVGIAFTSMSAALPVELSRYTSPAHQSTAATLIHGSSSDEDSRARDALMTESLDIEWSFVKSPTDRPGQPRSPGVYESVSHRSLPTTPVGSMVAPVSTVSSKASQRYASSRYDQLVDSDGSEQENKEPSHSRRYISKDANRSEAPRRNMIHVAFDEAELNPGNSHPSGGFRELPRDVHVENGHEPIESSKTVGRKDSTRSSFKYTEKKPSKAAGRHSSDGHNRHRRGNRGRRASWPEPKGRRKLRHRHSYPYWDGSGGRTSPANTYPYPYSYAPPFPFYPPCSIAQPGNAYPGSYFPPEYFQNMYYTTRHESLRRSCHSGRERMCREESKDETDTYSSSNSFTSSNTLSSQLTHSSPESEFGQSGKKNSVGRRSRLDEKSDGRNRDVRQTRRRDAASFESPYYPRPDFVRTYPSRHHSSTVLFTDTVNSRYPHLGIREAGAPSYIIPPHVQSPSFTALDSDRMIRLNISGRYDQKTSLHALVNTFKKTYESYASPLSKIKGSSEFWRRKTVLKRTEF